MEKNFKDLKDSITKRVFENIVGTEKNKDLKKFINEVKKSDILKLQNNVYHILENEKFDDKGDARMFLDKALRVFENYTHSEVESANKHIVEAFGGEFNGNDTVYKAIQNLYTKDTKVKNFNDFKTLYEGMVCEKPLIKESVDVEDPQITNKVIKRAIQILNDKFSFLNETERRIFKSFTNEDIEVKGEIYNELLSENVKLVKRKLFESQDDTLDEKLKLIESKLTEDTYNKDKTIEDFVKLLELSKTLS